MEPSELLEQAVRILDNLGIPYLITGSMAAMVYGEPRLTNDIDIVADIKEDHIPRLLASFPSEQFYISGDAIRAAIRHQKQFNIIDSSAGLKIGVVIRQNTPFNEGRFKRIRRIKTGDAAEANFASPEDIIIMKMRYYKEGQSEKHLRDISAMMKISRSEIDPSYLEYWAKELGLLEIWNSILNKLDATSS